MKKLRVAVLMGGKSAEHEISLVTGREVVKNLNPRKYDVLPIVVSRDGLTWQITSNEKKVGLPTIKNMTEPAKLKKGQQSMKRDAGGGLSEARIQIRSKLDVGRALFDSSKTTTTGIDVVFIAMHGPNGEDGTIQGFLELLGLPYTGSGVLASALGMDKFYSRKLFIQAGLTTPDYVIVRPRDKPNIVWKKFKPPVFVHPHNQGSAVGASLVKKKGDLKASLAFSHRYSKITLVDEYIKGTEVTCAILGNEKLQALPLVEIVPKKDFFDFEAKYNPKLVNEIVPARISKSLTKKAQDAALVAYQTLGCCGFGRVDMIIKDGQVYVLEVNTIPGLTPVSLFPKAAAAAGISYPKLLDKIIEFSTP